MFLPMKTPPVGLSSAAIWDAFTTSVLSLSCLYDLDPSTVNIWRNTVNQRPPGMGLHTGGCANIPTEPWNHWSSNFVYVVLGKFVVGLFSPPASWVLHYVNIILEELDCPSCRDLKCDSSVFLLIWSVSLACILYTLGTFSELSIPVFGRGERTSFNLSERYPLNKNKSTWTVVLMYLHTLGCVCVGGGGRVS